MRKGQLFNSTLCSLLSKLGHTDQIVIGDAGLPIPATTERIDLALTYNIPSFLQVFDVISQDMQIEKVILATEIKEKNPTIYTDILKRIAHLETQQQTQITLEFISHEALKAHSASAKAVIRTGECSPYANIILQSGVIF